MAEIAIFIAKKAGFAILGKVADRMGVSLASLGSGDSEELRQIQAIQKDIGRIIERQEALKLQLGDFEKSVNVQLSATVIRPPALEIMSFAEELKDMLESFAAQTTTTNIRDFRLFQKLQGKIEDRCFNLLSVYTKGCIDEPPGGHSYIYNVVQLFRSKYGDVGAGQNSYGLHRFVTDLQNVLERTAHIQHVAKLLLCKFVAQNESDHQRYAKREKENLTEHAGVMKGFLPLGISLDDEHGDRAFISPGSTSDPNAAWQLFDVYYTNDFLSSHNFVKAGRITPVHQLVEAHWNPYVCVTRKDRVDYNGALSFLQWQFRRQDSGLYKVWSLTSKQYICSDRGREEGYSDSDEKRGLANTLYGNPVYHTSNVQSSRADLRAVLFKLIVLDPSTKNPNDYCIRLVDTDFGSRGERIPGIFSPGAGARSFTLQKVTTKDSDFRFSPRPYYDSEHVSVYD